MSCPTMFLCCCIQRQNPPPMVKISEPDKIQEKQRPQTFAEKIAQFSKENRDNPKI